MQNLLDAIGHCILGKQHAGLKKKPVAKYGKKIKPTLASVTFLK